MSHTIRKRPEDDDDANLEAVREDHKRFRKTRTKREKRIEEMTAVEETVPGGGGIGG